MSEFNPKAFVFTTVSTDEADGLESFLYCGACGDDVSVWAKQNGSFSVDLSNFDAMSRAHWKEKHGG